MSVSVSAQISRPRTMPTSPMPTGGHQLLETQAIAVGPDCPRSVAVDCDDAVQRPTEGDRSSKPFRPTTEPLRVPYRLTDWNRLTPDGLPSASVHGVQALIQVGNPRRQEDD